MASLIKGKQLDQSTVTSREAKLVDAGAPLSGVAAGNTAVDGSSTALVRRDHQHAVATGAASGIDMGSTSAEGSSTNLARADHSHAISGTGTLTGVQAGQSTSDGTAVGVARKDHRHAVSTGTASGLSASTTNTEGSSTNLARADHTHAIDVSTGTVTNIDAGDTADAGTAIGLARKDHSHGVSTGGVTAGVNASSSAAEGTSTKLAREDHAHALDTTNGTLSTVKAGDSAVGGSATGVARKDHQHAVQTGAASSWSIGASNAEGSSSNLARADHTHAVGTPSTPNDVRVQTSAAGSSSNPARADHTHAAYVAAPTDVGVANAEGSAVSLSRSDHVHALSEAAKQAVLQEKRFAFGVQLVDLAATGSSTTGNALTKKVMDLSVSKAVGGSSAVSAIVTTAPDNRCEVRDNATNDPIHGVYSDVYGRLTQVSTALGGTYEWNGTTTVLTDDTSDVVIGDFIKHLATGACFEITGINPSTSVTISNPGALTIPTGSAGGNYKTTLTLSYYEENGSDVEVAYTFSSAKDIDVLFREGLDLYRAPFGALSSGVAFAEALPATHTHVLANITDVTSTSAEVNQVTDGVSANVTATNLGTLTGGGDAGSLHTHASAYAVLGHTHTLATGASDVTATSTEVNQVADGVSANVTAANLNTLTGGGNTTLHVHDAYVAKSVLTAKGDLLAASASATPARVPVGTDGQFLKADSGAAAGVSWASPASSDVERQEALTTQNIAGTDTAMTATLSYAPKSVSSVQLFLNGVMQEQGAGKDYTLGGTGNRTVTWLAATGTAVDMETSDNLLACYVQ